MGEQCEDRLLSEDLTGRSAWGHAEQKWRAGASKLMVGTAGDARMDDQEVSTMRQVLIYPGEDGFWVAECPSLPGCISQGSTREEAGSNILHAIELYLETLAEDGLPIPDERFGEFYVKRETDDHIVLRRNDPWAQVVIPNHRQLDRRILWSALSKTELDAEKPSGPAQPEIPMAFTISVLAGAKSSAHLDQFSSWLIGGISAGFTLLLANQSTIGLGSSQLKGFAISFLFVALVSVGEKYLASIVAASGEAVKEARELGEKSVIGDPERFLVAIEEATARPARWLLKWQFKKVREGQSLAPALLVSRLAQAQGLCVLLQAASVILAIMWLAWHLGGQ